jgi:short-subunit dehydrogenase involved in D-alanine esterification of teichoic acids
MTSIKDSKCVLVTGATSGIGRALAQSIARLPGKPCVIAVGRRQERLDELAKEGLETVQLDVEASYDALKEFADEIILKYPNVSHRRLHHPTSIPDSMWQLDSIIFCAGVQHEFNFKGEVDLSSKWLFKCYGTSFANPTY